MNWLVRTLLRGPSPKITVDLKAFLLDAEILGIQLGQTKLQVLSLLPDRQNDRWVNGDLEIVSYDDLEFHFSNDILYAIFADFDAVISGGPSLNLARKWMFERPASALSLASVLETLNHEKVPHAVKENEALQAKYIYFDSKVELQFETEGSKAEEDYRFIALSLSNFSLIESPVQQDKGR